MSELRKDYVSGRWVIIASDRSKRPDDFRPTSPPKRKEPPPFCPFCQGQESKTPPEIFAVRDRGTAPDTPGWRVRVVPNKFPALARGPFPHRKVEGVFESMDGVGVHEVVIESPDHNRELSDLPTDHVREVLETYRERLRSIEAEAQYEYIQLFKNKGEEAGASLSHPHSQIVATPIIPKRIKEEVHSSERLHRKYGECIYCRISREERAARARVVVFNQRFLAYAPFASRFPFEIHIHPLRHEAYFSQAEDVELGSLAEILKNVLSRLKTILSDPPYNFVLHQAPHPREARKVWPQIRQIFHWHLEISPVLSHVAGFELGTGFYINPVTPEVAAASLREIPVGSPR
jgi:UDPglucose--hexose-1-phosphate uridylyltransferase